MHLQIMFFWTNFFIHRYLSKCRNLYPFLITLECVDVVRCLHRTPYLTVGHFTLHSRSIPVGDASTYICILSIHDKVAKFYIVHQLTTIFFLFPNIKTN